MGFLDGRGLLVIERANKVVTCHFACLAYLFIPWSIPINPAFHEVCLKANVLTCIRPTQSVCNIGFDPLLHFLTSILGKPHPINLFGAAAAVLPLQNVA